MNYLSELPKRTTKRDSRIEYALLGVTAILAVFWMLS